MWWVPQYVYWYEVSGAPVHVLQKGFRCSNTRTGKGFWAINRCNFFNEVWSYACAPYTNVHKCVHLCVQLLGCQTISNAEISQVAVQETMSSLAAAYARRRVWKKKSKQLVITIAVKYIYLICKKTKVSHAFLYPLISTRSA